MLTPSGTTIEALSGGYFSFLRFCWLSLTLKEMPLTQEPFDMSFVASLWNAWRAFRHCMLGHIEEKFPGECTPLCSTSISITEMERRRRTWKTPTVNQRALQLLWPCAVLQNSQAPEAVGRPSQFRYRPGAPSLAGVAGAARRGGNGGGRRTEPRG